MERDTEMAIGHGADGVVFGILEAEGRVDIARTRRLRSLIGNREAVFHRAFDVTPDPFRAVDELVDLGITRILTSGQCDTVWEGLPLIARLVEYAGDRIQIMPGGGIKPHHVDEVIAKTGCRHIHVAVWKSQVDAVDPASAGGHLRRRAVSARGSVRRDRPHRRGRPGEARRTSLIGRTARPRPR